MHTSPHISLHTSLHISLHTRTAAANFAMLLPLSALRLYLFQQVLALPIMPGATLEDPATWTCNDVNHYC